MIRGCRNSQLASLFIWCYWYWYCCCYYCDTVWIPVQLKSTLTASAFHVPIPNLGGARGVRGVPLTNNPPTVTFRLERTTKLKDTGSSSSSSSGRRRNAASLQHDGLCESKNEHDHITCWSATTQTVNPFDCERVNEILQGLCSPAPQSFFLLNRAIQQYIEKNKNSSNQRATNTHNALSQVFSELSYLVKPSFQFTVLRPLDDQLLSCSELPIYWSVASRDIPAPIHNQSKNDPSSGSNGIPLKLHEMHVRSTLEMAHGALALVTEASDLNLPVDEQELSKIVKEAHHRLEVTLGTDIRGRASADAAFCFALAGIKDSDLFRKLLTTATYELKRTGSRSSFKSQYVLQIVEKIAAAGLRSETDEVEALHSIAAQCLLEKGQGQQYADTVKALSSLRYNLLNDRPLVWLWRFSSRLKKSTSNDPVPLWAMNLYNNGGDDAMTRDSWFESLEDSTRPLVIDVGCGLGVSLLGLSQQTEHSEAQSSAFATLPDTVTNWEKCNYVGCDLSRLTIGYADSIAYRWNVQHNVQFVQKSALDLLEEVYNVYPGKVALLMIQFPTPFRFAPDKATTATLGNGNTQLPRDTDSSGFMASEALLRGAVRLLRGTNGRILLQSNCEDVAVAMRQIAIDLGFECVPVRNSVVVPGNGGDQTSVRIPLRTQEWMAQGGERASGPGWSRDSLLPPNCDTETAVSCRMQGTPIHRCLLVHASRR